MRRGAVAANVSDAGQRHTEPRHVPLVRMLEPSGPRQRCRALRAGGRRSGTGQVGPAGHGGFGVGGTWERVNATLLGTARAESVEDGSQAGGQYGDGDGRPVADGSQLLRDAVPAKAALDAAATPAPTDASPSQPSATHT